MAISKNNPAVRDHQKLIIHCPDCQGEMILVRRVPGGMYYVCSKDGKTIPVTRGAYRSLPHEWVRK